MKHAALSFIRRLIGINQLAAHFDAIELQLGPIAQDLAELRKMLPIAQGVHFDTRIGAIEKQLRAHSSRSR